MLRKHITIAHIAIPLFIYTALVFSIIWALAVTSYAVYEYVTFPLKPFIEYMGSTADSYEEDAKRFWFIHIVKKTGGDDLSSSERAYFDKLIRDAKTQEEKQGLIEAKNVPSSASGLSAIFFAALVLPLLAGWAFVYAGIAIIKWVARGFNKNS